MIAQKKADPEFFFKYTKDSEGHLRNIFWVDSQSRIDYVAFGGVVVFDSTYRSNKYMLPFVPFVGLNHHRSTVLFGIGLVSEETVASYQWLLHVFLEAMSQTAPISVITDGDGAMAKAIATVWTGTDHRLCTWHIEENMVMHLRKKKLEEFREFIYRRWDVDEFEKRWEAYKVRFKIKPMGKRSSWVNRMYELRHKWAVAYTKGRYFLSTMSNQRSESLNSRLHVHLNRKMQLVDLLQHVEHCVSIMRKNEAALDAVATHTIPFTKLNAHPLEIAASYIYTTVMFPKVKRQIVEGTNWQVTDRVACDGLVVFGVLRKAPYDNVPYGRDARELQGKEGKYAEDLHAKKLDAEDPNDLEGKDAEDLHAKNLDAEDPNDLEGKDGVDLHAKNLDAKDPNDLEGKDSEELDAKKLDAQGVDAKPVDFIYHVTCLFTGARLDDAACKCKKLESQDYPCAHIFCVLDHLGVRTFPKKIVKKRWTMQAKPAFPSSRTANTHVWSDHMNKYHQLCNMVSVALFTAAASDSQSEQVMELLRSILVDGEKTDLDEGHKSFVPLPAYFSAARECCTDDVENPIKIVPKGRPTTEESNKRIKSRRERMRGKKSNEVSAHVYLIVHFHTCLQC